MREKQPLTQCLEEKLRAAGFAPPEEPPVQKRAHGRNKNCSRGNCRNPSKENTVQEKTNNSPETPPLDARAESINQLLQKLQQQEQQLQQLHQYQQQLMMQPPPPPIPLEVMAKFGGLMEALQKKVAAEPPPAKFQAKEVLTLAAKAGVTVVAVAAGTAAAAGIVKLILGDSTPDLPVV